jgi:hypothetical protein
MTIVSPVAGTPGSASLELNRRANIKKSFLLFFGTAI